VADAPVYGVIKETRKYSYMKNTLREGKLGSGGGKGAGVG